MNNGNFDFYKNQLGNTNVNHIYLWIKNFYMIIGYFDFNKNKHENIVRYKL